MFDGKRILVTGASGFLGQHVVRRLIETAARVAPLPGRSAEKGHGVDLRSRDDFKSILTWYKPDYVVHLAYPGSRGIQTSVETPAALVTDMLRMDLNVIEACAAAKIEKLLCVGSACAYPEHTTLPTDESQLWAGYPEPVNAAYGIAKRTQLMLLQAYRQQFGLHGIHLILANMYGPSDRSGHVIPATIAKVRRALQDGGPVVVWGRPDVTRSFLYVEDAAEGIVRALDRYDSPEPLNLCSLSETSMQMLVEHVAALMQYDGPITYDASRPTGHQRRAFSIDRLAQALDWTPTTPFPTGLSQTVRWYLEQP